jgi:Flp pilus assembly protein TadG
MRVTLFSCRRAQPSRSIPDLRHQEGSQILEFAMVLPLFLVFAIAAFDFGHVFALRDKLDNSAREGARQASQQTLFTEVFNGPPSANTAAVAQSVFDYLLQAKVVQGCALNGGKNSGAFVWTFTAKKCADDLTITVERNVLVAMNGGEVSMSRVTVSYPAHFLFFHTVIGLLAPGATYSSTFVLTPQATMQNL